MTKAFLILSILTLLGAGGLAVVNRSALVSSRTEKDAINKEIKKFKDDYDANYEKQFEKVAEEITAAATGLQEAKSKDDLISSSVRTRGKEIDVEKAKEEPLDAEIAEAEKLIRNFEESNPGEDFEARPVRIEAMEAQERDLKAEEEALRAETAIVAKKVETNTGVISRLQEKQVVRAKGIARNASTPVITAVNEEWGFVVINAGKDVIDTSSRLLVKRGGQVICRLKIVSIEQRMTVANIDRSTLAAGAAVLPGDQVIFQNLQN